MKKSIKDISYFETLIYKTLAINNDCQENIDKSLIGEFKFDKKLEELEKEFLDTSNELIRKYCQANCQVFPSNMAFIIQPNETLQYDTDELIKNGLIKGTFKQRLLYNIRKIWYKILFILFLVKTRIFKHDTYINNT